MRILPLRGYEIILGVEWLKEFGPIILDLNRFTQTVKKGDIMVILQGEWVPVENCMS